MNPTIIGIDPGQSGGIAWRAAGSVYAVPMPKTQGDMLAQLKMIHALSTKDCVGELAGVPPICYMEKPPMYIGGSDIPGSTVAVMFENIGFCKGVVQALGIPLYEITPQTWMKSLGIGKVTRQRAPNGATADEKKDVARLNAQAKRDWKNKLKGEAQRRYPTLAITLAKADAILIMDYGLRQNGMAAPVAQSLL